MNRTRVAATGAAVAAGLFAILWVAQLGGWLHPLNDAAESALQPLRRDVAYDARCRDGECRYEVRSWANGWGLLSYRSDADRNGTWNETHLRAESVVPWQGALAQLGDAWAAVAVAVAAVAALLLLGQWRTAALAAAVAVVAGSLVDPLKYGGDWAPYPSGHTIGATLMWGLALGLVPAAARRTGLPMTRGAETKAVMGWAVLAGLVGLDVFDTGMHVLSDVLLGWAFAAAFVLGAVALDGVGRPPIAPAEAGRT